MCGRYTLTQTDPAVVATRFRIAEDTVFTEGLGRYNAAPGQEVLTVCTGGDSTAFGSAARWGLVPSWATDLKTGYRMINARAEGLTTSRAYAPLFKSATGRCLIPADGFYEWLDPEAPRGPKRPVRFTVDGGELFALAGLTTEREWEGGRLRSCTIITTEANQAVAPVHDRMPVILDGPSAEATWLDPTSEVGDLVDLLAPSGAIRISSRLANPALNRVGAVPEGPALLESRPSA